MRKKFASWDRKGAAAHARRRFERKKRQVLECTVPYLTGAPYGNRTRVSAVKGRRPGPLDEGREVPGTYRELWHGGQASGRGHMRGRHCPRKRAMRDSRRDGMPAVPQISAA